MWWQLFLVLVATAAASEDDFEEDSSNCMRLIHHECRDRNPPDFPSNEEELEEFCINALKHFECIDRVLSSCEGEDTDVGRYFVDVGANLRRVCNEDAVLRTALAANLPCYEENWFEIQTCDTIRRDRDSFSEAINEIGITDVEEDDQPRSCLEILFDIGCAAATAGQLCGNAARDAVVNLLQGFDSPFEVCAPGSKEKLPEIAKVIQMEAEKVKSVEKTLKKKK